jgi:preprotein translocase subunit SecA
MAQKDPLVEYTAEGERMFTDLGRTIRAEVVLHLFHAELAPPEEGTPPPELVPQAAPPGGNGNLRYEHETSAGAEVIDAALGAGASTAALGVPAATGGTGTVQTVHASPHEKIGRNDPCWCGSGKKFKKCHGA